jgi:hypothetical protein
MGDIPALSSISSTPYRSAPIAISLRFKKELNLLKLTATITDRYGDRDIDAWYFKGYQFDATQFEELMASITDLMANYLIAGLGVQLTLPEELVTDHFNG